MLREDEIRVVMVDPEGREVERSREVLFSGALWRGQIVRLTIRGRERLLCVQKIHAVDEGRVVVAREILPAGSAGQ